MKELIGKTVNALFVNEDQSRLIFVCRDNSIIQYETYGDCCSETWFADITGVDNLIDAQVTVVDTVAAIEGVQDGRGRQEYDRAYGYKLQTTKGWVDIVYRNSSNGYYGGACYQCDSPLPTTLIAITEDWSA